jgi:hypothetical protein
LELALTPFGVLAAAITEATFVPTNWAVIVPLNVVLSGFAGVRLLRIYPRMLMETDASLPDCSSWKGPTHVPPPDSLLLSAPMSSEPSGTYRL